MNFLCRESLNSTDEISVIEVPGRAPGAAVFYCLLALPGRYPLISDIARSRASRFDVQSIKSFLLRLNKFTSILHVSLCDVKCFAAD